MNEGSSETAADEAVSDKGWPGGRVVAALVLLACATGFVLASYARRAWVASADPPQKVLVGLEKNFRLAVKDIAPDSHIGFYMGAPFTADENADGRTALYYIAQYAAAPRVMIPDDSPKLVLVFLPTEAALDDYLSRTSRRAVSRPAPGIAVTENLAP